MSCFLSWGSSWTKCTISQPGFPWFLLAAGHRYPSDNHSRTQTTWPICPPTNSANYSPLQLSYANHSSIDMYLINFRNHDVPYLCCHLGPISFDTCHHLGPFNCTSSLAFVACSAASFFSAVQRSSAWKLHRRNVVQTETRLKFLHKETRLEAQQF